MLLSLLGQPCIKGKPEILKQELKSRQRVYNKELQVKVFYSAS